MRTLVIGLALGGLAFLVFLMVLILTARNEPIGQPDSVFDDSLPAAHFNEEAT
jgi:hypothetical protein